MLENVDAVRVPAIFCQLIFYKLTWSEKTVDTFFISAQPFVRIAFSRQNPGGASGSVVATLGYNIQELAAVALLASHTARNHVVARANQFEII